MLTKKTILTLSLISALSTVTVGVTMAGSNDFSAADYNRLLNGDKNLSCAKLEGANLQGKDLSGVNFENAELEKANLSNANLTGANLEHADLEESNLKCANLTNANLKYADLEQANLKGANIKGAILKEAELEFATWPSGKICAEGSIGGCW